jgi:hypothetical protein
MLSCFLAIKLPWSPANSKSSHHGPDIPMDRDKLFPCDQ